MKTFKQFAYDILKEVGRPLHVREITRRALEGGLVTNGKSPNETMAALLIVDINKNRDKSPFMRTNPNTFALNTRKDTTKKVTEEEFSLNKYVTTRQKGDIAEARIAELAILYAKEGLSCYKPISDDEGVDVVLKKRGENKAYFLQVKSRFASKIRGVYTSYVPKKSIMKSDSMGVVFCSFDISIGDIREYLRFIPADEFIKNARLVKLKSGDAYLFVAGRERNDQNKRNKYLIDKRELGDKIIEQIKK